MTPTAPPGWYPHPDGGRRWWDGQGWAPAQGPGTALVTQQPSAGPWGAQQLPGPPPGYHQPYGQHGYGPQQGYGQPSYGQPGYYGMPIVAVAPKNAGLSLLASFFIPGLGTMINGEGGKGAGILVGYIVSVVLTVVIIGIVGVLGFWVWGMVDAYQGAQKWNRAHGILS